MATGQQGPVVSGIPVESILSGSPERSSGPRKPRLDKRSSFLQWFWFAHDYLTDLQDRLRELSAMPILLPWGDGDPTYKPGKQSHWAIEHPVETGRELPTT